MELTENHSLNEILGLFEKEKLAVKTVIRASVNTKIKGLASDSRRSGKYFIFFCKGEDFRSEYAEAAIRNGAVAVVYSKHNREKAVEASGINSVTSVEVTSTEKAMAVAAAAFYGYPIKQMVSIAVTGTKGKTTAVHYISKAIDQTRNLKSGLLSDYISEDAPRLTTPEAIDFHMAARRAADDGCTHLICEISSQAQKMLRTYGITFDYGCFLNLGTDHISPREHCDMEDYYRCKASLFANCRTAIINADDVYGKRLYEELPDGIDKITFSVSSKNADFYAGKITEERYGCDFSVCEKPLRKGNPIITSGPGRFNAVNALCAFAVCRQEGVSPEQIFTGILNGRPAGRGERLETRDGKITVIVDYAHNAMSFEGLLTSIEKTDKNEPVTVIFGCPGDKGLCRREELARICCEKSDAVIVSDDDGGKEGYGNISRQMEEYFRKYADKKGVRLKSARVIFIESRKKALAAAFESAKDRKGKSIILMLGKGAEDKMKVGACDKSCESDIEIAESVIRRYDSMKSLSETFSKIKRKKGTRILVKAGSGEIIAKEFASSLSCLKRYGVEVCCVCEMMDTELIRLDCFKEGIASVVYSGAPEDNRFALRLEADMRMGVVPLVCSNDNIEKTLETVRKMCKFDDLVYLETEKGILSSGIGKVKKLSFRRAEIIAGICGKTRICQAVNVLKSGISEVALLDGTSSKALACYVLGSGYKGTVITERRKRDCPIPERKIKCADLSDSVTQRKKTDS